MTFGGALRSLHQACISACTRTVDRLFGFDLEPEEREWLEKAVAHPEPSAHELLPADAEADAVNR